MNRKKALRKLYRLSGTQSSGTGTSLRRRDASGRVIIATRHIVGPTRPRLRPTRSSTTPSRWLKKKSSQSEFATAEWEFPPPTVGLCCLLGRLGVSKRRLGPTQGRLGPTGGDSRGRFGARRAHSLGRVGAREADSLTPLGPSHPGVLDVRSRSDFSRFDPRPYARRGPRLATSIGPPTERRPGGGGEGGSSLRRTDVL